MSFLDETVFGVVLAGLRDSNIQQKILSEVSSHYFFLFAALRHIVGVPIKALNNRYIYLKKLTFQKIKVKVDKMVPLIKLMKGVQILEIMGNGVEIEE